MRTAVIAIGGNAIIKEDQRGTAEEQLANICSLSEGLTDIIKTYNVVLTHGNGPQIGNILLANESSDKFPQMPLDVCSAYSQGGIGYMIQQALGDKLKEKGIKKSVSTIITQVVVDKKDISFQNPTKPIGPFYSKEEAEEMCMTKGWQVMEDAGRGYRRVVPSPKPVDIVEKDIIKKLVASGEVVIACGGGGIPVIYSHAKRVSIRGICEANSEVKKKAHKLEGIAAVIDKDLASSLLATLINAELFLILTYVDKVAINFNKPDQQWLSRITVRDAKEYLAQGHFPAGSMGPKITAAVDFIEKGGKRAIITSWDYISQALAGNAGTEIVPEEWF